MQTRSQKRKVIIYTTDHNNVLTKIPKLENNNTNSDNSDMSSVSSQSFDESESNKYSESNNNSSDDSESDKYPESDNNSSDDSLEYSDSEISSSESKELESDEEEFKSNTGESYDNILEIFDDNIKSILTGDFFNLYSNEYDLKNIKTKYSIKSIESLNKKLYSLKSKYIIPNADIDKILNMNINEDLKSKLLEKCYLLFNSDILSSEYNHHLKEFKELLYYSNSNELIELDNKLSNCIDNDNTGDISLSYKYKILKSEMPFNNKIIAYKYMKVIDNYNDNSSEEINKYKTWLNTLLTIPFNKYYQLDITNNSNILDIQNYLFKIREILDTNLSFLDYPKDQIINIIAKLIRNPSSTINAIGMYGNKGIGKTFFIESIAKALNRPLVKISLGGSTDVHTLQGHNFTYIGSKQGIIVDGLIKSKVMNPIFYFDEIDKITQSHHGSDITGFLIHLIDLTSNANFNNDEYFSGIEFDLSRALFIFTYNDPNLVDPILSDRLYKIFINNYKKEEKFIITKKHIINSILNEFGFNNSDIIFDDNVINEIINLSDDIGMRDIKKNIHLIISRLNVLLYTKPNLNIITLDYKKLYNTYSKLPIRLQSNDIKLLLDLNKKNTDNNYLNIYV